MHPAFSKVGGKIVYEQKNNFSLFMVSKVSTLVHLNRIYIAVFTPGVMSHVVAVYIYWVWHLIY